MGKSMRPVRRPRHGGRTKGRHILAEALESRRLLAADLVISEFLASNSHSITDSGGNHADWIEIHNRGDAPANLNDYFLTDDAGDPEQWRFPAQTLAAGAYLVVFADGTIAPPVANTELHTNFKLGADGEYLGLINAADDSVAFEYAPQFPAQTADVSYGLSDANDPASAKTSFSVPTPGAANNPSVAAPTFSSPGRVFTGTIAVTLSTTTPGAVIHYTTDNSTPTASSPVYTAPINLTQSTPIRAIATAAGYTSSPIAGQTYERVDSTVTSVQNANLPIIIIDTYGVTMNDTTHIAASATFMDTTSGSTDLLAGTPDYQGRIGIHIRGSTSEGYPKQQYAIELWDESNDDKKVSLLGMPADSDWILYDPYTELSLMQNQLAYQWANETGHYASRTRFVEVYVSTGGNTYAGNTSTINYAANYMGIYILEEKVKVGDDRVDVGDQISAANPNGGFVIQQDRYTGTNYFVTPQGVHMVLQDPDDNTVKSYISTAWNDFENALFSGSAGPNQPWSTPGNANYYGNYIDVASFVDYFLLNEMTRNIDAFWLSTFYNKAADTVVNGVVTQRGLISAGPVWDFNLSLGAANYNSSADSAGWNTYTLTPAPGATGVTGFNPQDAYFQRLLTDPNFVQAVSDRWNQLRQGVFSTDTLIADIDADVTLLSAGTGVYPVGTNPTGTPSPVMRNFQKWPELGVYVTTVGMYDPAGQWIENVNLMKNWLIGRVNWMDSQFIPQPILTPGGDYTDPVPVTMTPIGPVTTTDVQLIGPNSTVYYRVPTGAISGWQTLDATSQPAGWSTGTAGLGYDLSTSPINFLPYISTNVQSLMSGKRADIYTLMNFAISDPDATEALILKIRYDDGFTAWVNGVRVMDANTRENTNPAYNATAAGSGDDTQAILYREFDITSIKSLLRAGNNTLAIQGMNSGTGSDDFLLSPTLYARTYAYPQAGTVYYTFDGSDPRGADGLPSAGALVYSGGLVLTSNARITARTYVGGAWSAVADQFYDFTANSLRITELMFNPPPGAGYSTQDYEYVEVRNVGTIPLDLSGYQFTKGITFPFPAVTLAPGAYGVIVKNPAAFAARYGSSANVLGTYSGSLDNSGERVTLTDPLGQTVETFTYDPAWYPQTNGGGNSLVVADPTGDTAALDTAAGWRASYVSTGAPGVADADLGTPAVLTGLVDDIAGQPKVHLTFNAFISAGSPANLTVTNVLTHASVAVAGVSFDGNMITFTLPTSLASGVYRFTLPAGQALNVSGTGNASPYTFAVALVRAGQTLQLPVTPTPLVVQQLSIDTGAALDLGEGALLLDYDGPSPAAQIRAMLASGRNGGTWNGADIVSSAAASNAIPHGIGYAETAMLGLTSVAGQAVDATTLLLKYTLAGDANLDGRITADDYTLADRGKAKGLDTWVFGDFDYSGSVTAADLTLLNQTAAALAAPPSPTVATPEPETAEDEVVQPIALPVVVTPPPTQPITTTNAPTTASPAKKAKTSTPARPKSKPKAKPKKAPKPAPKPKTQPKKKAAPQPKVTPKKKPTSAHSKTKKSH